MRRRWLNLNPIGVLLGAVMLVLSLSPSLLPRPAVLQGVGSGIIFGIWYAIGLGLATILAAVTTWRPSAKTRRAYRLIGWPLFAVAFVGAAISGVAAQNDVRRAVELPPMDGVNVLGFVVALTVTTLACLGLGRLINRAWHRSLDRKEAAGQSRAKASRRATIRVAVGGVIVVALVIGGLSFALDRVFYASNSLPAEGVAVPDGRYRSGGDGSEVKFTELGRMGADFVTGAPTAEQITELTGKPATTPIRVYVGLAAGGTMADRAQIAVEELERTGAFERKVLVVATPTGQGWLEPQAVDSVEFLHSGDTAIAALQYAYTPSFVSALGAPELPVEASTELFDAVHARWAQLPRASRPKLVVYGLSLGSQGLMNGFGSLDEMRARVDGALLVGPTNATGMWRDLQAARDAGSPPWQPVLDDGREVRWASQAGDFNNLPGPWDAPRVAILQHATDPITWLGKEVFWQRPEWLKQGNRAPDVSPQMRWIPIVTGAHLLIDNLVSVDVPARHGHAFGDVMLDGWVGATGDGGLDAAAMARIRELIEGYWVIRPYTR